MPPAKLKVLISGGGVAGLTLAVLLERAGIDYEVFERAAIVRPLGSALSIGPNVLPMFEQLGLLENVLALAKENDFVSNFNEDMQLTSTISYLEFSKRTGYSNYVIPRPDLYDLLYSQLPQEKIHMGKRVASLEQHDASNSSGVDDTDEMKKNSGGVTVTFTDNTTAHGDILVGSDGAYSGVRKSLYDQLKQQGKLPHSDLEELPCSSICLVGQTGPLSTEKFPHLTEKYCRFESISGKDKPFSWFTLCLPNNSICWVVTEHLHTETSRAAIETNVEWGPGAADAMIDRVRDFPIPSGPEGVNLTLADLIDETPRELISRVPLEGKFFETWYAGRVVLVGDACHKMYPSGAQGANTAIQDAIVLANYINDMSDSEPDTIKKAFEGYHRERVESARIAHETSERLRHLFRRRMINTLIRALIKYIPQWAWNRSFTPSKELNTQVISVQDLQRGVYDLVDCSHKAILVVDEPELHASDLGKNGRDRLKSQVYGAESSLQIPFVDGAIDLESLAENLSQKCHTPLVNANAVDDIVSSPSVIYKKLTSDSVAENDHTLDLIINEIRNKFQDEFLVLYSSSQIKDIPTKHHLSARQLPGEPTPTKQAGVFHNYTFFSQGIFMGLLIAVIVIPIAVMGVFWNLSVQQPQRFEKKQN
ncbi:hypothetical protein BGX26_010476 [Mortierella sp. AD094]|nr:hypothetical protein BGX26_010476 [Mortierella sp. AD094]